MLREAGKRDRGRLIAFLDEHAPADAEDDAPLRDRAPRRRRAATIDGDPARRRLARGSATPIASRTSARTGAGERPRLLGAAVEHRLELGGIVAQLGVALANRCQELGDRVADRCLEIAVAPAIELCLDPPRARCRERRRGSRSGSRSPPCRPRRPARRTSRPESVTALRNFLRIRVGLVEDVDGAGLPAAGRRHLAAGSCRSMIRAPTPGSGARARPGSARSAR